MCRPDDFPPHDELEDEHGPFPTESEVIARKLSSLPHEKSDLPPMTELEKEDLRDAIEFDLL